MKKSREICGERDEQQIIEYRQTEMCVYFIELRSSADGKLMSRWAGDVIYVCSIMGALLSSHKDGLALSVWWGAELNCSEWEKSRRVRSDRCLDGAFSGSLITSGGPSWLSGGFSGENNWHRMQNYMQHNLPAPHLMSTIQQLLQHPCISTV